LISPDRPGHGRKLSLNLSRTAAIVKYIPVILLLIGLVMAERVSAQDLEPRRWSHLPTGLNLVGVGYVYAEADVFFSPVLRITDGTSRINLIGLTAIHTFDLAGKSARFSMLLPTVSGRWEGNVDDEFQIIHRRGIGDPRLRLSVNLYGAPALEGSQFAQYRAEHATNTVVGASLALTVPLGKYCDDCLINIGANRWSARPQIGVVHTRGPWSLELSGSAFLFADNDSFFDNIILKQKTVYALQAHAVYNFKPGLWVSISSGYGTGGQIKLDQEKTAYEVDNWLWAASFGVPVAKAQSIKLTWLSGRTQNSVGRDSDNLLLSWSMKWSN
jgi:hypothetical protein